MKFRQTKTSSEKVILAGRNAKNNEELIAQVEKNEVVLHTAAPGSPFVNIKGKAKRKDIKEAAIFCAVHSQEWRDNKTDILVHKFKGKDIYKKSNMKIGTFGIRKFKIIKVKKKWIEIFIKKEKINK